MPTMPEKSPMTSPRAVLHVGLPKTGTSFLQGVLRGNTEVLGRHGVRLPVGADKPLSPSCSRPCST